MASTSNSTSDTQAAMPPASRTVWPTVVIYAVIVLALAGAGGLFVRSQKAEMQRRVENELNAIADLKVQQILDWRRERLNDAAFFSEAPFVPRDVRAFFENPASMSTKAEVVRWMTLLKGNDRYSRVSLFDARGELRLTLPEDADPAGTTLRSHAVEVLRDPRIYMTDLHRGDADDINLNLAFPVLAATAGNGPAVRPATNAAPLLAVIVLELDPRQFLYPLIQRWPMPSRTAETLLVRREGDDVLFLNELRHRTNSALVLRMPIQQKDLPAAIAARGKAGVWHAVDYRGVPVLAATRAVPESPWFLVAKVDQEEIYAPLRQQLWLAGALAGALALAGGLGLMAVWHGRETAFLRQDLVRRREAEAALGQERQFLGAVLDNIGEAVVACDAQGVLTRFNEAARELHALPALPIPPEEWAQHYSLFQADGKTPLRKEEVPLFRALQGERVRGVEMVVAPKNRPARLVLVNAQPMYGAEGRLLGAVAAMHDITERKRAAEELNKFVLLANSSSEFIGMCDLHLQPLYVNPAGIRMVGLPDLAAACRVKVQDYFFPEDQRFIAEEFFPRVLRDGHGEVEIRLRHFQTGAAIWVSYYLFSVRDAAGTPVGWATVSHDITERKQSQEALRLRDSALKASANAIVITDVKGRIVWVNPAFHRLTGYSQDEALGQNPRLLKSGRHGRLFYQELWQTILAGRVWQGEMINRHKDGHLYTEEMTITPVADTSGRITHFIAVKQDITARKEAEENLRAQARLLDLAQDAIVVRDMDGRVRFWNQSCERLTGFSAAEALGRSCNELVHLDPARQEEATGALLHHDHWSGELTLARKDGSHVTVMSRWTLVRDELGRPKSVLVINTDVTEQKRLEAQFQRAQRLEAIGALASGIAHDLNNILAPILMMAPLLRESVPDEDSRRMVDTLESCAQRGGDIIKQLLIFARGAPGTRIALPVSRMLRDMGKLIQETFPRDISPVVDAPKNLWPVLGDPTQLQQVLMNLCVNARDAMPEGGTLSLSAQNVAVDETFASMVLDAQPGDYVCIRVSDTGHGIPPDHLERIFDPFFTTKEAGKGTGLGLATVLGIVRGHQGFVRVDTQVDRGTTFELYFPATPEAQISPASAQRPPPPRGQGELILVVDDEAAVRDSVRHTLERHGYRVVTAAEGAEGVVAFTRRAAEIRAVVTDMMMPVMNGPALIAALRKLRPDLVALGMTGLMERDMVKGQGELEVAALLTKPFTSEELLCALHAALAPAEPPAAPPNV